MLADNREVFERYGVTPDWTTLAGYWKALERARPAINLGTFVGAGGVRNLVIGESDRRPTPDELRQMEAAVAQAMEEGALGLSHLAPSTCPTASPPPRRSSRWRRWRAATAAPTSPTSARSRYEIDASLDEVFRIAREAEIPAQIYHLKTSGRPQLGTHARRCSSGIEQARAEGLDVTADQYPYIAGHELARREPAAVGARRRPRQDDRARSRTRRCARA